MKTYQILSLIKGLKNILDHNTFIGKNYSPGNRYDIDKQHGAHMGTTRWMLPE